MNRWLIMSVLLIATGCGVKPTIQGRQDPYGRQQIHFADEDIRTATAVGTPIVSQDNSGNLAYVTIPIRAASYLRQFIEYRVTFFDSHGQPINQTTWFPKTLEPSVPDSITVNSVSPRAADFQVDFRNAK